MKKSVIAIVGPTAVGKTNLSIQLAKAYNGEVISGDSMQVYRGMDIGTAKVTKEEMEGIPHHLIDIKNPDEEYSVHEFQRLARQHIEEISSRNRLPILVGGSGLYIQAALYDYRFSSSKRNALLTDKLKQTALKKGNMYLYERLKKIDPEYAKKVHPNNIRRIIRALEIYETTGRTMSEYHEQQTLTSPYRLHIIGLEMERTQLYARIEKRVDRMVEKGLVEEVKRLYDKGYEHCQSMQAIGYKEFIPYFKGELSLAESIDLLKRNSRRFAKRQFTWFKNKMEVKWYVIEENAEGKTFPIIFQDVEGFLENK
ncbi:tRNA dimethylallyltransferase [Compostibacillus humi]|uniref:tRNA dimethylallyltransferase n=1 Tax=Compostibacillus humi TaxID=1245525 RepID=A0A8J2ZR06_9BACI|nr:tRNA (adenosine(37)-N6)-dimethylallyltransferase MiaA [Compostibacillus humi]GGH73862.1 tRNA dimethylallyltransferase [Compostibacillus humi]